MIEKSKDGQKKSQSEDKEDKISTKKEQEEEIETEITYKLDKKDSTVKHDVSEENENSFIYDLFGRTVVTHILDDKSLKNKNKVKSTFIRFIFVKTDSKGKNFNAIITKNKRLKKLINLNFFTPKLISDRVEGNDLVNFHSIYRFRENLPFIKSDNMAITIDFD